MYYAAWMVGCIVRLAAVSGRFTIFAWILNQFSNFSELSMRVIFHGVASVALSYCAGVIVEKSNKAVIIILFDFVAACLILAPIFLKSLYNNYSFNVVLISYFSAHFAFQSPARTSLIRQIVPAEKIGQAYATANFAGGVLASVIAALMGHLFISGNDACALAICSMIHIVGACCGVVLINVGRNPNNNDQRSGVGFLPSLKLRGNMSICQSVFAYTLIDASLIIGYFLLPAQFSRNDLSSYIVSSMIVGGIIGAASLRLMLVWYSKDVILRIYLFVYIVAWIMIGNNPPFAISIISCAMITFGGQAFSLVLEIIQSTTPANRQSRIQSLNNTLSGLWVTVLMAAVLCFSYREAVLFVSLIFSVSALYVFLATIDIRSPRAK